MFKSRSHRKTVTLSSPAAKAHDEIELALCARAETGCCVRCKGLLVPYTAVGNEEESSSHWDAALRCVNCGEVVDALILRHRSFGLLERPHPRR